MCPAIETGKELVLGFLISKAKASKTEGSRVDEMRKQNSDQRRGSQRAVGLKGCFASSPAHCTPHPGPGPTQLWNRAAPTVRVARVGRPQATRGLPDRTQDAR